MLNKLEKHHFVVCREKLFRQWFQWLKPLDERLMGKNAIEAVTWPYQLVLASLRIRHQQTCAPRQDEGQPLVQYSSSEPGFNWTFVTTIHFSGNMKDQEMDGMMPWGRKQTLHKNGPKSSPSQWHGGKQWSGDGGMETFLTKKIEEGLPWWPNG